MARRLPPLNALKAFEAAARHESLTRAAGELSVSHAAVSRHIRALEQGLHVALFERTGRGVRLTEAGRTLAKDLTEAFDLLAHAAGRFVRPGRRRQRLTVTSDVPFAAYWLVPRIGGFTRAHPQIDLVLDPNPRPIDFTREEADLGVRFGSGPWRGVASEKLFDAELIVVCNAALLKSQKVSSPADLEPATLIQEQDRAYWSLWLEAAGVAGCIMPSGPTLLADLTVAAAEAGQGFALSDKLLAASGLATGRLVAPFDVSVRVHGYHLVRKEGAALSRPAQLFRAWLLCELSRTLSGLDPTARGASPKAAAQRKPRRRA